MWSLLLLGVTFCCRVLPWPFADATPENGIADIRVHTWIFALFPVHFPPATPCTHIEHTHKDVEKKVSCEVKEFAHGKISTVVKTTGDKKTMQKSNMDPQSDRIGKQTECR